MYSITLDGARSLQRTCRFRFWREKNSRAREREREPVSLCEKGVFENERKPFVVCERGRCLAWSSVASRGDLTLTLESSVSSSKEASVQAAPVEQISSASSAKVFPRAS